MAVCLPGESSALCLVRFGNELSLDAGTSGPGASFSRILSSDQNRKSSGSTTTCLDHPGARLCLRAKGNQARPKLKLFCSVWRILEISPSQSPT